MIAEHNSPDGSIAFPLLFAQQTGGSSTSELFGGAPSAPPAGGGTTQGQPLPPAQPSGGSQSLLLIFALPVLFIVLLSMWTSKKERKKRDTLYGSLKKNDRVLTMGGIIGTITEIRDDVIVLRVDDKTKIEFAKSAITQVVKPRDGSSEPDPQIETKTKGEKATA